MGVVRARLADLHAAGLISETADVVAARVAVAATLEECLDGAAHVQENGPERVEVKRETFARLDALCGPEVVLASSTSGIPASAFTEALAGRARCLVAHPVNPPYLVPLVELVGAPWTDPAVVARTRALMDGVGQVPVVALKETRGFVLNRLQAALVAEGFRLVRDGVMSVEDVDACVKEGLGLRWSFMGPFETIELNAPGGVADYCARYTGFYKRLADDAAHSEVYKAPNIDRVIEAWPHEAAPERLARRTRWRNERLAALAAHKRDAVRDA